MIDLNDYQLRDTSELISPALVLFREVLEHNLAETIRLCGGPDRWRPHVKTHKTREIVRLQQRAGVSRFKCATLAEAEMLGALQVPDVLLAYPLVGPNQLRFARLVADCPGTRFSTVVDSPLVAGQLGEIFQRLGLEVGVWLELNTGMDRTGVNLNRDALELYELLGSTAGLRIEGLHWYDGHHRQSDASERRLAVLDGWQHLTRFRDQLLLSGWPVPRIVAGGTGSFAILAETAEPGLELSPGTTTLYDADCSERFPELPFRPAVAIYTRVVSQPGCERLTVDVGHKACAADPPAGRRLAFPQLPDAREVQHTEEHLVLETTGAGEWSVGQGLWALSRHICPTMAAHDEVLVAAAGEIVDRWEIWARGRRPRAAAVL